MGSPPAILRLSRLTLIVSFVSVASFAIAGFALLRSDADPPRGTTLVLTATAIVAIVAQTFVRQTSHFLALIGTQMFIAVALLRALPENVAFLQSILTVPLVLQTAIRMPPRLSVFVSAVLIFVVSVSPDLESFEAIEFLAGLTVETVTLILGVILVSHRERLVNAQTVIAEQSNAIDNLTAANESFAERLPEMRRHGAQNERLRITRELHDSLGYGLTNIVMLLNASERLVKKKPDTAVELVGRARDLASVLMDETRDTLYALRSISDDLHANPAIFFDRFCADFETATGIRAECHSGSLNSPLPENVFHFLLRAVQVAFINALRHSEASHIQLFLSMNADDLSMTVWNRTSLGRYEPTVERQGIGLTGLRERLVDLGGVLQTRHVGDEFSLEIRIPVEGFSD